MGTKEDSFIFLQEILNLLKAFLKGLVFGEGFVVLFVCFETGFYHVVEADLQLASLPGLRLEVRPNKHSSHRELRRNCPQNISFFLKDAISLFPATTTHFFLI